MMTPRAQALFRGINRVLILLALFSVSAYSLAKVKAEDYGMLPEHRNVTISPDAKHYAVIARVSGGESFVVADIESDEVVSMASLDALKARDIFFASNRFIVFTASRANRSFFRGKGYHREESSSYAMDIKTGEVTPLLNGTLDLLPNKNMLRIISGVDDKDEVVFMPAYTRTKKASFFTPNYQLSDPRRDLYRVNLKTGLAEIHVKGDFNTLQWFMDNRGKVLAREDYNDKRQLHRVYSYVSGKRRLIYESKSEALDIHITALSPDEQNLLYAKEGVVYQMSLIDGATSDSGYASPGNEIQSLNTGLNRKLLSITYSGLLPFDEPLDSEVAKSFQAFKEMVPRNHLQFVSASLDGTQIVARISGNDSSGSYVYFNRKANEMKLLGKEYSKVTKADIGEITTLSYKSRDGVVIPSVVTWPVSIDSNQRKKLPLLVFPHDGPANFDYVSFNWWAQYFARKGYVILQPNFRGSSGFGKEYQNLGNKEWGKAMQSDVTDGVLALIKSGHVDAERVCIMGASYGGYSALAGGAFSPELYRCVISVSGISDLPLLLKDVKSIEGRKHRVSRYFKKTVGSSKTDRKNLKAVSPSRFAHNYVAPVLLLHGENDSVVPFKQSKIMHKALLKAGKNSQLIELKGEDHWLSKSETRLAMLKAIEAFLEEHNPL